MTTAATLSPASSTHLEFTQTSQTVTIINDADNVYTIENVTYEHEKGIEFDDMVITFSRNTFTYQSKFDNAVDRVVYYTVEEMVKDSNGNEDLKLVEYTVNNFTLLPEEYSTVFQVDNPQESVTVTFKASGTHEYRTVSEDEMGAVTETWSTKPFGPVQFVATIETNMDVHIKLIKEYVGKGKYAQMSPSKPVGSESPEMKPELPEFIRPTQRTDQDETTDEE